MTSTARHSRSEGLHHRTDWQDEPALTSPIAALESALNHRDPDLKDHLTASATNQLSHQNADWITQESWHVDDSGNYSTLKDTAAHTLFASLMEATESQPDKTTADNLAHAITGPIHHSVAERRQQDFPLDPQPEQRQAVWSTSRILESNANVLQRRMAQALSDADESAFALAVRDLHHTAQDLDHAAKEPTDHPFITNLEHHNPELAQQILEALDHRLQLRNNPDYSAVAVDPHSSRFEIPEFPWLQADNEATQNIFDSFKESVDGRSNAYANDTALQLTSTLDAGLTAAVRRMQLLDPASKWNEPNIKGFDIQQWRAKVGPQLTDQRETASKALLGALTTQDHDAYQAAVQDLGRINEQLHQNLATKTPSKR